MSTRWCVWALLAVWAAPGLLRAGEPAAPVEPARVESGLSCSRPVFDFGEVPADSTITNTFSLRNAATNPVVILNVRSGCGCTTVSLATNRVAPGGGTALTVVLSLAGRRGPQRKAIYLETDDPRQPRLRLEIQGVAVTAIMAQPQGVHFGTLGRDGEAQQDVLLTARSNVTFHIKGVTSGSSPFTAEVETREPGTSYWVHVKTVGPRTPGTVSALLQVATDLPAMPQVLIPVSVFVAADVIAVPSHLILVASGTNEFRTANLALYSPAGKPFAVQSIDWPAGSVTGRVASAAGDRVRIEVRSSGRLEDLEGKAIRIVTDLDTAREILVPLRVMRLAAP